MKFLRNMIERIKSMAAGRRETEYHLTADNTGVHLSWLTLENEADEDHLKWDEIVLAKVFKRDFFSMDCICYGL